MTTNPVPADVDLSALSLPELLQAGRALQETLPNLPGVRQPGADPDLDALNRELGRIGPVRRALMTHLLRVLGTPDADAPECHALNVLTILCREEGLRNGRAHAALRQAWLARMTALATHTPTAEGTGALSGTGSLTRDGWNIQREQLNRQIEKLRHQVTELQGQLGTVRLNGTPGRKNSASRPQGSAAARTELLAALRSRDDALAAQDRLEERLSRVVELYGDDVLARRLGTPGEREREKLLSHFRRRLKERFKLNLSYAEVSALDRQARLMPITHRTGRGSAVKLLQVAGTGVYAVVTPDRGGDLTLTTAYTAAMLDQIGGF